MTDLRIERIDLDQPEARDLEQQHSAEMSMRYGGGGEVDDPPIDAQQFRPPSGAFLVAWRSGETVARGEAVACAGFRALGGPRAELKRFFVAPQARRTGVGRALLRAVEEAAADCGYRELWLETGTAQPEAIALYETSGYRAVEAYGEYRDYDGSRCFARTLSPRR